MKEEYQIAGFLKITEEDIYDDGCQPDTTIHTEVDIILRGGTLEELVNEILKFFGVEKDSVDFNSCDEVGRVDVSILENKYGYAANESEVSGWENGNVRLWLANYSGYVERIYSESVDLSEFSN